MGRYLECLGDASCEFSARLDVGKGEFGDDAGGERGCKNPGGFVNSTPDFIDAPKVINGASDLMVAAFGDKGRHARAAVGVASLPADCAVEIDGVFEVA